MEKIFTNKKFLQMLGSAIVLLMVVFLNPKGSSTLSSFNQNFQKNFYLDHCTLGSSEEATGSSSLLTVLEVVDGDTIDVSKDCKSVKVRLVGINSPESVDPNRPVQCYGPEASKYAKSLLTRTKVQIQSDPYSDTYDKYGRLLGYVIMQDGTNFNQKMIEDGYAYEYTYNKVAYQYQKEFKQAEADARNNQRGLWAANTCNGKV